jgi:hypothetical protein
MTSRVKVRFPFATSEGDEEIETMWTVERPDGYEIDNIPFYVKELALGDVVSVQPDTDGVLRYSRLVRPSHHSTIRLWFADEHDVDRIRAELQQLGCPSELSDLPRLVAVDIPPNVPYAWIKTVLDRGEREGTFEYQEACLGFLPPT